MSEGFVSTSETAALLGISKSTVIRLFHEGQLKGYRRTANGPIMISLQSIDHFKTIVQRRPVPDAVLQAG